MPRRGAISGPSYLFQTSAGDGELVDLYARNVAHPATSSLYGEIYKYLPNDTDLTPFLQAGFTGYNFAFIGNVARLSHAARYHRAISIPSACKARATMRWA